MNVFLPSNPVLEPVPRNTEAPWLSRRSDKWRLVGAWTVYLDDIEWTVPDGYITDLSSIPRPVWWLFPRGYSPARRAAILHDWLYSHGYRWCTKEYADESFRSIMLEDGAPGWIAAVFYRAVRLNVNGGGW